MVNTEERGNAHSDGGSPSHMTSPLFVEQWAAALFSRVEKTTHLWAVGWLGRELEVLVHVGGLTVHLGRERAIIIVQYRNIQKWSLFSLRRELDVLVDGVDVG